MARDPSATRVTLCNYLPKHGSNGAQLSLKSNVRTTHVLINFGPTVSFENSLLPSTQPYS